MTHSRAESIRRRTALSDAFERRRCVMLVTAWL